MCAARSCKCDATLQEASNGTCSGRRGPNCSGGRHRNRLRSPRIHHQQRDHGCCGSVVLTVSQPFLNRRLDHRQLLATDSFASSSRGRPDPRSSIPIHAFQDKRVS